MLGLIGIGFIAGALPGFIGEVSEMLCTPVPRLRLKKIGIRAGEQWRMGGFCEPYVFRHQCVAPLIHIFASAMNRDPVFSMRNIPPSNISQSCINRVTSDHIIWRFVSAKNIIPVSI